EGILLTSAFTAVAVAYATGSATLGLLAAVGAGVLVSVGHALLVERARVHAVVSGIAINLLALSGTRLALRGIFGSASNSASIDVTRVRVTALAISGAICALGGVHLAFDQRRFESGMSNGRGFIALAAVIVSGWRAGRACVACLAFGALGALENVLQDRTRNASAGYLVQLLPYV